MKKNIFLFVSYDIHCVYMLSDRHIQTSRKSTSHARIERFQKGMKQNELKKLAIYSQQPHNSTMFLIFFYSLSW